MMVKPNSDRISKFFDQINRRFSYLKRAEGNASLFNNLYLDYPCQCLFNEICSALEDKEIHVYYSLTRLERVTSYHHNRILNRVSRLANFGLLAVQSEYKLDGSRKKKPWLFTINPLVYFCLFDNSCGVKERSDQASYLGEVGYARSLHFADSNEKKSHQGFHVGVHAEFGSYAGLSLSDSSMIEMTRKNALDELMSTVDAKKEEKKRLLAEKRRKEQLFIDVCGLVWRRGQAQIRAGVLNAEANWSGEVGSLGSVARGQRRELVKLFERWGGEVFFIAWYLFNYSFPVKDPKTGNIAYIPGLPHFQFVGPDKKPEQFSKHFNSILADNKFIEYISKQKYSEVISSFEKIFLNDENKFLLFAPPSDGVPIEDRLGVKPGFADPETARIAINGKTMSGAQSGGG